MSKLTTLLRKTFTQPNSVAGGHSTSIYAHSAITISGSYIESSVELSPTPLSSSNCLHARNARHVQSI